MAPDARGEGREPSHRVRFYIHMNFLIDLLSDELKIAAGAGSSPSVVRRFLLQCDKVRGVRKALAEGLLTEASVERFTEILMKDFVRGEQFKHELPLAALAVAIESRRTKFTEDYLLDLARLSKISEMDLAPRVAILSRHAACY